MEEQTFSMEPIEQETQLEAEKVSLVEQAKAITVKNQESYDLASNFIKRVNESIKKVVDVFKEPKESAHKTHKSICDKEKALTDSLTSAVAIVKKTMVVYVEEQKRIEQEIQRKQEEARRIESDRLMKEAAEAEKNGNQFQAEVSMQMAQSLETPSNFTGNTKQQGTRVTKSLVIVDEMAVPRELCVPDMAKIKAYYALTNKVPAGVQIQEATTIVAR